MILFKCLVASFVALSPLAVEEDGKDGWFLVEQPQLNQQEGDVEPSLWVIFIKQLGVDKIYVQFPSAPAFRHIAPGVSEISSEKNGELFQLTVWEKGIAFDGDSSLRLGDQWVRRDIVETPSHVFQFLTVCDLANSQNYQIFVNSFQVEKIAFS